MRNKTLLGAIPVIYDAPTGGDVVTDYSGGAGGGLPSGGLYDSSGTGSGTQASNELPGGGPGMQVEPKESPKPLDEVPRNSDGTPQNDEATSSYLPWIIGGVVLFMLLRKK